jgi:hypothetical protein
MASTFDMNLSTNTYRTQILTLATDIIWKNTSTANLYETIDSIYKSEIFINANRGLLNWEIVDSIPKEVFIRLGYDVDDAEFYSTNKNKIPENMRDIVIEEYQYALSSKNPNTGRYEYNVPIYVDGQTIDHYVTLYEETNNYYRMLMGLPDMEDTDYVYYTKNIKIPNDIPIHELSLAYRLDIEDSGYLDELIELYPEKKYLKYIGSKSIDFYTSRVADRFEILWMNTVDDTSTIQNDFQSIYEYNRNMVLNVYYSEAFKKDNSYYEPFLALSILLMTIQVMNSLYLQKDINRDFYDTDSIRAIYESYKVPFYSEIPLDIHKKIVKAMNILISYKGSTEVILDLFDIFNLGNMDLYEYYLIKARRFDSNNNPIFVYETNPDGSYKLDENGNKILSEDQSSAYDIYFSKSNIKSDAQLDLVNESNMVDYDKIIANDPYWKDDSSLQEKLKSESFNYNETKYIGVENVFNLMDITYQTVYAIKAILDNKNTTDEIMLTNGADIEASLYDYLIYLGALYCKQHGWEGVISSDMMTVSAYLGYDFECNIQYLQDKAYYDEYILRDTTLYNYINSLSTENITKVNSTIELIMDLRTYLGNKMVNAKTTEEFHIYKEIYNSLLVGEYTKEAFGLEDGESTTYSELLKDVSPQLYSRYLTIEDPLDEIEATVVMIETSITNLEYLSFIMGLDTNNSFDSLYKILKFFKSAKAEIVSFDLIYNLSDKLCCFIKYLDLLVFISNIFATMKDKIISLTDYLKLCRFYLEFDKDWFNFFTDENHKNYLRNWFKDKFDRLTDYLKIISNKFLNKYYSEILTVDDLFRLFNKIHLLREGIVDGDGHTFTEILIVAFEEMIGGYKSTNYHLEDDYIDKSNSSGAVESTIMTIDELISVVDRVLNLQDYLLNENDEIFTDKLKLLWEHCLNRYIDHEVLIDDVRMNSFTAIIRDYLTLIENIILIRNKYHLINTDTYIYNDEYEELSTIEHFSSLFTLHELYKIISKFNTYDTQIFKDILPLIFTKASDNDLQLIYDRFDDLDHIFKYSDTITIDDFITYALEYIKLYEEEINLLIETIKMTNGTQIINEVESLEDLLIDVLDSESQLNLFRTKNHHYDDDFKIISDTSYYESEISFIIDTLKINGNKDYPRVFGDTFVLENIFKDYMEEGDNIPTYSSANHYYIDEFDTVGSINLSDTSIINESFEKTNIDLYKYIDTQVFDEVFKDNLKKKTKEEFDSYFRISDIFINDELLSNDSDIYEDEFKSLKDYMISIILINDIYYSSNNHVYDDNMRFISNNYNIPNKSGYEILDDITDIINKRKTILEAMSKLNDNITLIKETNSIKSTSSLSFGDLFIEKLIKVIDEELPDTIFSIVDTLKYMVINNDIVFNDNLDWLYDSLKSTIDVKTKRKSSITFGDSLFELSTQ